MKGLGSWHRERFAVNAAVVARALTWSGLKSLFLSHARAIAAHSAVEGVLKAKGNQGRNSGLDSSFLLSGFGLILPILASLASGRRVQAIRDGLVFLCS